MRLLNWSMGCCLLWAGCSDVHKDTPLSDASVAQAQSSQSMEDAGPVQEPRSDSPADAGAPQKPSSQAKSEVGVAQKPSAQAKSDAGTAQKPSAPAMPDASAQAKPDAGASPQAKPDAGASPQALPDAGASPQALPDAGASPQATPDAGAPHVTPDAGAPHVTPDAGAPHVTPDAGAPQATPDAGAPHVTPDAGAPQATPDAGAPHATPDAGAPHATPDAGAPQATPDAATPAAPPVVVSLTFDDQRVSQSVAGELLAANGRNFKATFFVISRFVDGTEAAGKHPESLSVQQLRDLERAGHEIGGHTRTHPALLELDRDQQTAEICGGRDDLLGYGFKPLLSFAYPSGSYDAQLESVVASCGYTAARTVKGGLESIPPQNPFALRTARGGSITRTDSLSTIESWVSDASPGQWVQLVWHDLESPERAARDEYAQSVDDFTALLDFLKRERAAGRVVVKTIGEVMRSAR